MIEEKQIEKERYDARALAVSHTGLPIASDDDWYGYVPLVYRTPYNYYVSMIGRLLDRSAEVLEIGSGTGAFTGVLLRTEAKVVASDISVFSLDVLKKRYDAYDTLETKVADMESLPFPDDSFDAVSCAGSLSYGDNLLVMNEIYRVLRSGGKFICVDSFNHNPVYKLNRWLHFRKGKRTKSTLLRMPSLSMIENYASRFSAVDVRYFGSISWMMTVLEKIMGGDATVMLSDTVDKLVRVRRSAFKIVMIATK